MTLVVLRVNSVDARSRAIDTKSRRYNTKFSSMSLFIGLFSLKIADESHFKLLCFCFTNTVILAGKNLNPMHKLCFFSEPIFQYLYFHLRSLTDLTLEVDMLSLKLFVKNMHNLMHFHMVYVNALLLINKYMNFKFFALNRKLAESILKKIVQ